MRTTRGQVPREWVVTFTRSANEPLQHCQWQVELLAESQIDVRQFADQITAVTDAFAAPSLQIPSPAMQAVSLLFARILFFLRAGFRFCRDFAAERYFEDLEYQCGLLARILARPAARPAPYASPSSYRRHLGVFAELATEADPLQALRISRFNNWSDARYTGPRAYSSRRPPPTEDGIAPRKREPYIDDASVVQIATPIVLPDVLANAERPGDRFYRVWYGTDRTPIRPDDPGLGFSANCDTQLHFGSCLVFVPESHLEGSLGSSWIVRVFTRRPDDRLRLDAIRPLTREAFQAGISAELARRRDSRTALVYIHGFNVTFEQAALKAAQLACDLAVNGVTAFYSWASAGEVRAYARDEETVRLTVDHFVEFLDMLLEINGMERADIIAHSMGNRLLAAVIERLNLPAQRARIGHIVLAAPDIGRSEFNRVSHHYPAVALERATLYSCARDRALAISTKLHDYLRIGYEPPVYFCDGIDTVSANRVKLDALGHGYIASAKPVIADLKKLLWNNMPPAQRRLIPVPDAETPEYWLLNAK